MKSWFSSISEHEDLQKAAANWRSNGPISYEWMVTLGALLLLTVALLIWAYYFRKRRRRKPKYHYPSGAAHKSGAAEAAAAKKAEHRRRRRRRDHRPRNPTRAETGGLPSIHPEHSPDSTV